MFERTWPIAPGRKGSFFYFGPSELEYWNAIISKTARAAEKTASEGNRKVRTYIANPTALLL